MRRVRLVAPRATLALEHPAYLLRPSAAGLAVAAPAGQATVTDLALSRCTRIAAKGAIEDVALSPNGKIAALIDDEGLRLFELGRDSVRWRIVGKGFACHFSACGDGLWVVRPSAQPPGSWLELRDVANGATLRKLPLDDPFGGSAFTLAPHADPRGILVWIAAPEAATRTLSVISAPELYAQILPLGDGYPPEPIPGAPDYLAVTAGVLERRRWLDHAITEQLHWPWLDDEELAILALSPARALWASRTGRLHLIDTAEMTYVEEMALAARPPRPLREVMPDSDDPRWGTDLQQLCVVGGNLVLQYGDSLLYAAPIDELL